MLKSTYICPCYSLTIAINIIYEIIYISPKSQGLSNKYGYKQIEVCKQKPYKVLKRSNEDEWELCYDETLDLFCEN